MGATKNIANKLIKKHADKSDDWGFVKSRIEKEVDRYLQKKTGRRPMVIVHAILV